VCTTCTHHRLFHVFCRRRGCIYLRHQMGNWGNGSIQSRACHTQPHVWQHTSSTVLGCPRDSSDQNDYSSCLHLLIARAPEYLGRDLIKGVVEDASLFSSTLGADPLCVGATHAVGGHPDPERVVSAVVAFLKPGSSVYVGDARVSAGRSHDRGGPATATFSQTCFPVFSFRQTARARYPMGLISA